MEDKEIRFYAWTIIILLLVNLFLLIAFWTGGCKVDNIEEFENKSAICFIKGENCERSYGKLNEGMEIKQFKG